MAARAVPAFYLHFIYCGMQFAVVANESNMRIAIIPKENEKSEPFSNRKQVRIFLVRWARVDCASRAAKKAPQGLFPRRTVRRVDAVRIHPCIPFFKADKTETPVPGSDTGVLGGRGWIARAALLKTAHWAVFALSSATAPQLFESTRSMSLALLQNKNLSVLVYVEAFWWARVDSNHRS